MKNLTIQRWNNRVELKSATGNLTIDDLLQACEDNDFSLNSSVTGHLMLLDDRNEETFMLNDYGVDVIEVLNETGNFTAPISILEYSEFQD